MEGLLGELLRRLIWGALGAGVEKLIAGPQVPQLSMGELGTVASLHHPRACACPSCDDRFILGLDDDEDE